MRPTKRRSNNKKVADQASALIWTDQEHFSGRRLRAFLPTAGVRRAIPVRAPTRALALPGSNMASVGALSARPHLGGSSLRRSGAKRIGKVSTVARAEHKPGINMPDGPAEDLNKWSRKITQPKSQGASQVRQATHQIRYANRRSALSPDRVSPHASRRTAAAITRKRIPN